MENNLSFLKAVLNTATFKQSLITSGGTLVNGLLGALFYILLARNLGPESFGLLAVSIATLTLLADIADLGTNTGIVKFIPENLRSNPEKAYQLLKLSLLIKVAIWFLLLIVFFFLSDFLAKFIFNKIELSSYLKLVAVGVGGALLFSFTTTTLQAFEKFASWSLINIITNALRLIIAGALIYLNIVDLSNSLITYITLPFFGFFLAMMILPARKILKQPFKIDLAKEIFHYNIYVALFTLFAAVSSRLDTFLTTRILSVYDLGIYSSANQLITFVPQLISALGIVSAPKFASFTSKKDMIIYFKKLQYLVLILGALGLIGIPLAYFFIPMLLGSVYYAAITPFVILLSAMIVFLISLPTHMSIFYYYGKPQVFLLVAIGHLLVILFLGYYAISNYGVIGAAVAVLVGNIFNFIAPLLWLIYRLRKNENLG